MTSTIKERPITFSKESVLAILAGRKTQTRRVIHWKLREPGLNLGFSGLEAGYYCSDLPSSGWVLRSRGGSSGCWNDRTWPLHCPHGMAGDRLWVREAWRTGSKIDKLNASEIAEKCEVTNFPKPWAPVQYEADDSRVNWLEEDFGGPGRLRRARYMPRWASRVLLEVTEVRVQRVQEISEEDAIAEGVDLVPIEAVPRQAVWSRRQDYAQLWDHINAERGFDWASNPWVFAISFRRVP